MKIYSMMAVVTVLAIAAGAVGAELTVRVYPAPPDFAGAHSRPKGEQETLVDAGLSRESGRSGDDAEPAVRLVANTLADIYPGRMYDMTMLLREFFGILSSERALAWMNPDRTTLIVRGTEGDHEIIEELVLPGSHQPFNLELLVKVILPPERDGDPAIASSWKTITRSGRPSKVRLETREGMGLEAEIDAVLCESRFYVYVEIALVATLKDELYSTDTEFTTTIGHTKALTMGMESGDGRNARIEVSANLSEEPKMPPESWDETGEIVKMIEPLLPE